MAEHDILFLTMIYMNFDEASQVEFWCSRIVDTLIGKLPNTVSTRNVNAPLISLSHCRKTTFTSFYGYRGVLYPRTEMFSPRIMKIFFHEKHLVDAVI